MKPLMTFIVSVFIAALFAGCSQLETALRDVDLSELGYGKQNALDEKTIIAGLKEALRVGSGRAVTRTSSLNGYLGNKLIRIATPDELLKVARALRKIGLDKEVDKFEVAMNRAAEKSAGQARDLLWSAIKQMQLKDVRKIWRGNDRAATDYFRNKTERELYQRFRPVVLTQMNATGLYRAHKKIMAKYMKIPFVKKPDFDLDRYITRKTLDGLFTVLAQEEARIRKDPVARTTDLLRKVFG